MFKTLFNAFKVKDIRKKLLIVLGLILVYRVGCAIVCPGLDLSSEMESATQGTTFFSLMNMLSGNALSNGSILALGVSPYITASIVIQLLTVAIPPLERLAKQGEDGKKKMQFYTRITALVLALAQAIGIVVSFQSALNTDILQVPTWVIGMGVVLILTAGAMFTVWIGEKITQLGVCGSGMSILIFVGILASSASGISDAITQAIDDPNNIWMIIIYIVAVILIFGLIVFMDNSERRVPVSYAKQIKGRRMYGGQDTYIPIKLNSSGVMPIIFATSLLTLPQLIISIFWPNSSAATWYNTWLGTSSWIYIVVLALLIFAFAFFYSMITFDTNDISRRLQQQGGFVKGIRPGRETSEYLKKISRRITLFGAFFLAFIALLPSLAFKAIDDYSALTSLINAFSATGLMIIVSVALEFDKNLEAQMYMRNYKGFLD
ncbi:MAG TPA: preprotein translocase subunit SecY [Candidatus Caccovivens faecavium]|nr:preprotein translocase subunit SecY [Candidatus Caccovivens faecavium]